MKMASTAGSIASRAAQITNRTLSMFRAIFAENGIADTNNDTIEQEMVMFLG